MSKDVGKIWLLLHGIPKASSMMDLMRKTQWRGYIYTAGAYEIHNLAEKGYLVLTKKGRSYKLGLTQKGKLLEQKLHELMPVFEELGITEVTAREKLK